MTKTVARVTPMRIVSRLEKETYVESCLDEMLFLGMDRADDNTWDMILFSSLKPQALTNKRINIARVSLFENLLFVLEDEGNLFIWAG